MKKITFLFILILNFFSGKTQINTFSIVGQAPNYFAITCANPTANISVISLPGGAPLNFTCVGSSIISTGTNAPITSPGTYTLITNNGTVNVSLPLSILANTTAPVIGTSPTLQTTTSSSMVFTITSVSPTININQYVYSATGGSYLVNSPYATYLASTPGTYTHCVEDITNGCITCNIFNLVLNPIGLPQTNMASGFSLYPNPAQNNIQLNVPYKVAAEIYRYELLNALGQRIWQEQSAQEKLEINTEGLKNGIYFLRINPANHPPETLRFIIQK